jgi:RNA polymerase sigma factor (sigma-70 family)
VWVDVNIPGGLQHIGFGSAPTSVATDGQSFSVEDLYRSEYASLVRLALALTGRGELAEELVQDTFIAAQRNWNRIENYDNAATWLRRVLTNRCISRHRRSITEALLLLKLKGQRQLLADQSSTDEQLWALVRALPKNQRQSVALFYVDDRPVNEIAAILGCNDETVRTHLRRARTTLASQLSEPISSEKN